MKCGQFAQVYRCLFERVFRGPEAGGVDQGYGQAGEFDIGADPVAGGSRLIGHDGGSSSHQPIEKRGFSDVWRTDDGDSHAVNQPLGDSESFDDIAQFTNDFGWGDGDSVPDIRYPLWPMSPLRQKKPRREFCLGEREKFKHLKINLVIRCPIPCMVSCRLVDRTPSVLQADEDSFDDSDSGMSANVHTWLFVKSIGRDNHVVNDLITIDEPCEFRLTMRQGEGAIVAETLEVRSDHFECTRAFHANHRDRADSVGC